MEITKTQQNFYGDKTQNKKARQNSILAGLGAELAIGAASEIPNKFILNKMIQLNEQVTPVEYATIVDAFDKTLAHSGIKDARIVTIDKDYINNSKNPLIKSIKAGKNAGYDVTNNIFLFPKDKMALARFHELGHAINNKLTKYGKLIQVSRLPMQTLAVLIPFYILFTNNKTKKDNNNPSCGDKFKNFIHNNGGKLAFLSLLPMVAEEGIASYHGEKAAKKFLSPEILSRVRKSNLMGLSTYALLAVVSGIIPPIVKKVQDKVYEKNIQ